MWEMVLAGASSPRYWALPRYPKTVRIRLSWEEAGFWMGKLAGGGWGACSWFLDRSSSVFQFLPTEGMVYTQHGGHLPQHMLWVPGCFILRFLCRMLVDRGKGHARLGGPGGSGQACFLVQGQLSSLRVFMWERDRERELRGKRRTRKT